MQQWLPVRSLQSITTLSLVPSYTAWYVSEQLSQSRQLLYSGASSDSQAHNVLTASLKAEH